MERQRENCWLLKLPRDVLRYVLEFTLIRDELYATTQWKWTSQIGAVCCDFRALSQELAPNTLDISSHESLAREALVARLLQSFCSTSWKREKLVEIRCRMGKGASHLACTCNSRVAKSLRSLMKKVLPNLEKLSLSIGKTSSEEEGLDNFDFLEAIAPNLPRLVCLELEEFRHLQLRISPEEFGKFGAMLKNPLETLNITWSAISDAHLSAFLQHQGSTLAELNVSCFPPAGERLSDSSLVAITQHCKRLEKFIVRHGHVTGQGLEGLLKANRGTLHTLDISDCRLLGPSFLDVLTQHAPQLETFSAQYCRWFTDEALERIVQGQINHWQISGRQDIPLSKVLACCSKVSEAGIHRVLRKKGHTGTLDIIRIPTYGA